MSDSATRAPAVAGTFYPADPARLRETVSGLLSQADRDLAELVLPDQVRGLIAPHAGYMFSGGVAARAFAAARRCEPAPQRAVLIGPAHYVGGVGAALPPARFFSHPLGVHPVDQQASERLVASGVVEISEAAHQREHSLEVMLPFIQLLWGDLPIVPLVCGHIDYRKLTEAVDSVLGPGDILIISSDLSHFHPAATAEQLDAALLEAWVEGDMSRLGQGEACGKLPILTSMELGRRHGWQRVLLGYAHSGMSHGSVESVVGYGAGVHHDP